MTLTAPPRTTAPWDRRRRLLVAAGVGTVLLLVVSAKSVGVSLPTLVDGTAAIADIARRSVPPHWDDFWFDVQQMWVTICIALVGTAIAAVASVPLALLAARTTTPSRSVGGVARAVIVGTRAVPDLVFALIFAGALGIGPLPGALALGVHSIGMIGKLLTDAIEEASPGPLEAVRSTGTSRLQVVGAAVAPAVAVQYTTAVLYRFEINVRQSVVLGLVGGGGIGFYLQSAIGTTRWPTVLGLVLIIVPVVLAVEQLSSVLRHRIERAGTTTAPARPGATLPPFTARRAARWTMTAALGVLLWFAAGRSGVTPSALWHAVPKIGTTLARMFPPALSEAGRIATGLWETFQIGLVGTALGLAVALPVSLFAARNLVPSRVLGWLVRMGLALSRALPELAIAVIFVAAVGLGPFAGALALAVTTFGFGAKLFADAVELEPAGPHEAVVSTGATRPQRAFASAVPLALPGLVAATLYCLDVAVRSSVVLGTVGAGGLGYDLEESIRLLNYRVTGAYLLGIFAMVYVLEMLAVRVRKALI